MLAYEFKLGLEICYHCIVVMGYDHQFHSGLIDTCKTIIFFFQFNFVGKLLGPQGNSLKRLQHETGTKMSILGRGSMRDKAKVKG